MKRDYLEKKCTVCEKIYSNKRRTNLEFKKSKYCSYSCYRPGLLRKVNENESIKCGNKFCELYIVKNTKLNKVIFDKKELEFVKSRYWVIGTDGYAISWANRTFNYLHWNIVGKSPKGYIIDHINRNKLDNRKANLRFITPLGNKINVSTKPYTTYFYNKEKNKKMYVFSITYKGKTYRKKTSRFKDVSKLKKWVNSLRNEFIKNEIYK